MHKILTLLAVFIATISPATAQDAALRELVTGDDSKGWEAVGRLDFSGNSFCTGAMISEDLVLTAAHCLFDKDTGIRADASEIEFLVGLRNGRATAYRKVRSAVIHPQYKLSVKNEQARVRYDVALIKLAQPVRNSTVTPFSTHTRPRKGAKVGVVSYAHNRADAPSVQDVCHVLARQSGTLILSCDVDFGSSGSPVFVMENGEPRIVSVVSAKASVNGRPVSLGTALDGSLDALMAEMDAQGDGVFGKPVPVARRLTLQGGHNGAGAKFLRP